MVANRPETSCFRILPTVDLCHLVLELKTDRMSPTQASAPLPSPKLTHNVFWSYCPSRQRRFVLSQALGLLGLWHWAQEMCLQHP